jgi:hypothetical protein
MEPLLPSSGFEVRVTDHLLLLPIIHSGDGVNKDEVSILRDNDIEHVALFSGRIPDMQMQ